MAFFSGNLHWLWLILANSLRIFGGLLREPDLLDRAIGIWDLGWVVRAIDNVAFLQGYADPFLCVKLLVGCCMDSIFISIEGTSTASLGVTRKCGLEKNKFYKWNLCILDQWAFEMPVGIKVDSLA